ncbi:M48 family metallopeptidase [Patescibacteria group bacterium]|nr:M48 family metallopeptidase [Patescibacteria group bacterium]
MEKLEIKITRKPIRSLRLRLANKNTLLVSAPRLVPTSVIDKFIHDNEAWIQRQRLRFTPPPSLADLRTLSLLGRRYNLIIQTAYRDSVVILDNQQLIRLHTLNLSSTHLKLVFEKHFRPYALKIIKTELYRLQKIHHFTFHRITVRNQSSRFGSCSASGNLSFNWQIIFFPEAQFRHILLHEAAHLTHHNHSRAFWQLLASYDPEWRLHRLWVKKEGSRHILIKS